MGIVQINRSTSQRSDDILTRSELLRTYISSQSSRVMLVAVALLLVVRPLYGNWSTTDLVMLAMTGFLLGFVEWVLHLFLLHAPEDSVRMEKYGTGRGHREHHLDPQNVGWILLSGVDAALFTVIIAIWTAIWAMPVAFILGGPIVGSYLTALLAAYVSLAHYEWVHLMVHTRVRPKSRYYRRLAKNHRLHHYRNEHHWLGVTSNLGDRFLRTYPKSKADVPLSDTARTL